MKIEVFADADAVEVLQLFNLAEKSAAFAILLKSPPLILRHLKKCGFRQNRNVFSRIKSLQHFRTLWSMYWV
jgi:hypothetical protein